MLIRNTHPDMPAFCPSISERRLRLGGPFGGCCGSFTTKQVCDSPLNRAPCPHCSAHALSPPLSKSELQGTHEALERWPSPRIPMLDVGYQTENLPSSSPAPSPQTLFANLSKRIRALTGAGQTRFVPKLSSSSTAPGRSCQTESRQMLRGSTSS